MAYSINPNLPHARAIAMKLRIAEGLPSAVVANKCGVHRSTIWRWKCKWLEINKNISQEKPNRPTRITSFVAQYYRWSIPTECSAPHTSPHAVAESIVQRILQLRHILNRCAELSGTIWCTETGSL